MHLIVSAYEDKPYSRNTWATVSLLEYYAGLRGYSNVAMCVGVWLGKPEVSLYIPESDITTLRKLVHRACSVHNQSCALVIANGVAAFVNADTDFTTLHFDHAVWYSNTRPADGIDYTDLLNGTYLTLEKL